ncbi:hypothetical protein ACVBR5_000913 [Burkholderia cenocepacia]
MTDDELVALSKHLPEGCEVKSATTDGDAVYAVLELCAALQYIYISHDALRSVT